MPARFIFTRLSPLGAAVLILIMVLMLYPVLPPNPPEAHAATRLGLHVTQEELNIWRQRRTDNVGSIGGLTYQTIYNNRILADADTFKSQSHPQGDGYWVGYTGSGCVPGGQRYAPTRGSGAQLFKSAFVFLVTGDTSYADSVKMELLNQITVPGTNWANSSKWCPYDGTAAHIYGADAMEITPWIERLLLAYDYLKAGGYTGFTAQNDADIRAWFLSAANVWMTVGEGHVKQVASGALNTPPDYTCNGPACPGGTPYRLTHYNGYDVYGPGEVFANQTAAAHLLGMMVGIMLNDTELVRKTALFVKAKLHFGTYANGAISDQMRWSDCNPSCPASSWAHGTGDYSLSFSITDYLARTGDTSLYTYSTSNGAYTSVGGPKSIETISRHYARMVNGTIQEYGTRDGSQLNSSTLLTWNPPDGNRYLDLIGMVTNVFYKNSEVHQAMNRVELSSCVHSGAGCYTGPIGNYPDLPFMWGNLDSGQINPYTAASPTPTPTPSPTPTPQQAPIAHYTFDEPSGTQASDSSGTNPATLFNAPVFTTGKLANALSLNGTNQYGRIPRTTQFESPSLTLSAWIKRNGTQV